MKGWLLIGVALVLPSLVNSLYYLLDVIHVSNALFDLLRGIELGSKLALFYFLRNRFDCRDDRMNWS